MILRTSSIPAKAGKAITIRRRLTALASVGLLGLVGLCAGAPANAQPVHFHYIGGRWSHRWHDGWHRYWGGPTIGFYYAPYPVWVVPGYAAPSYYVGPGFWYSNPSFGLSLNFGGGGYYSGPAYYHRGVVRRWHGGGAHYYHGRYRR
jgi:hypothetical protein